MSYDTAVQLAMNEVPEALAAGLVDIDSGMMLSIKTLESHPQRILDFLGPATQEMFEGDTVTTIEHLFKQARGAPSTEHFFQEILISSTHLWHYFGRLKSNPQLILTVVCRESVNLGLLILKARQVSRSTMA